MRANRRASHTRGVHRVESPHAALYLSLSIHGRTPRRLGGRPQVLACKRRQYDDSDFGADLCTRCAPTRNPLFQVAHEPHSSTEELSKRILDVSNSLPIDEDESQEMGKAGKQEAEEDNEILIRTLKERSHQFQDKAKVSEGCEKGTPMLYSSTLSSLAVSCQLRLLAVTGITS
eukprot:scpid88541/ scgid1206/ 